ncbi:MAG: putative hemagglutinin-related protein, partial [Rhizobacter sp.]|nr:putative hemagglutinin-related protein [Rhizobacter sp.]
ALQLAVAADIDNTGGTIAASRLALNGRGLRNDSGVIDSDRAVVDVQSFENGSGDVLAHHLDIGAASLSNAGGRLRSSADMRLSVTGAFENRLGEMWAGGGLDLSAGSVANGGTIDADGDVRVSSAGAVRNRGTISSGGDVSLTAAEIDNRRGSVQAERTLDLRSAGLLDNGNGELLGIASLDLAAGQLDNTHGSLRSAGRVALRASETSEVVGSSGGLVVGNDHGSLIAGSLDLRLSRLSNVDGLISADHLSVEAGAIDNRAGLVQQTGTGVMTLVARDAFDNAAGRVIGNGDVQVVARGLSNRGGSITAASVSGSLMRSSLNVSTAAALDNALGTLAATGDVNLDAWALDNSQGRVTAGQAIVLRVDDAFVNVQGSVAASGSARIVAARIDNSRGTLAANDRVELLAGRIDNTGGTIASIRNSLTIASTGSDAIVDRGGRLQSALELKMTGAGLDNAGGTVSGGNVAIDTGMAALRNAAGVIVATGRLDVASGALDNDAGRLQAGAALTVDTHGAALANTRSGDKNGIVGLAAVTLRTGDLDNTAGFIGAKAGLSLEAAAVKNAQGGVVTGETSVALKATSIDNTGGMLDAAHTLLLEALGTIDNTRGSISGNDVVLRDSTRSGAGKRSAGDERAGPLGIAEADAPKLAGDEAQKTLVVANDRGSVTAKDSLVVDSARLVGTGVLSSQGSLAVSLQGDHVQTGVFEAGADASLSVTGKLTNQTVMRAGKTLTIDADSVDNTATGEMTGQTTVVHVARTLTNRGLIDGEDTRLTADAIDNLGTGRIYGDALSIQARALRNDVDDAASPVPASPVPGKSRPAGTIASRGRLDIGVQTLVNREGALLFSLRDMAIGGTLDGNRRVTGRAASIANASATIEALGALAVSADRIANTNEHFETAMRTVTSDHVDIEHALTSDGRHYAAADVRLVELLADGSGALIYRTHDAADIDWLGNRDRRQLLLPSSDYPFEKFAAYYASSDAIAPSGDYRAGECRDTCDQSLLPGRHYAASDPIWSTFGVDPATGDAALDTALFDFRSSLQRRAVEDWNYFKTTASETTPVTVRSAPGRIASGGDMTLLGVDITNDKSRIVAGGDLVLRGASVRNLGAVGTATVESTGVAVHTYKSGCGSCDEDDRVHVSAAYDVSTSHAVESSLGEVSTHASEPAGRTVAARNASGAPGDSAGPRAPAVGARAGDGGNADSNIAGDASGANSGGLGSPARVTAPARPVGSALGLAAADAARSSVFEIAATTIANAGLSSGAASARTDAAVIRTARPGFALPDSSLFTQNPASQSAYLVETDPRFANYRQWLGSDYLLGQLHVDAALSQKRLGDGFYEQQLLREQVAQLTGRR